MSDHPLDPSKPSLYVSMLHGPTTYYRDAGIPFHREVVSVLGELDIVEETTAAIEDIYPDLPPFPAKRGPVASVELTELAVGLGLYLAGALGNGAVDQLVEKVYERAVRPALSRCWKKLIQHRHRSIMVVFDHWYDETGVLVRVEFLSRNPDEAVPDLALVLRARTLAIEYIQEHGLTHRVMAYRSPTVIWIRCPGWPSEFPRSGNRFSAEWPCSAQRTHSAFGATHPR